MRASCLCREFCPMRMPGPLTPCKPRQRELKTSRLPRLKSRCHFVWHLPHKRDHKLHSAVPICWMGASHEFSTDVVMSVQESANERGNVTAKERAMHRNIKEQCRRTCSLSAHTGCEHPCGSQMVAAEASEVLYKRVTLQRPQRCRGFGWQRNQRGCTHAGILHLGATASSSCCVGTGGIAW